jgi:hypothetical protein
MQLFLTGRCGDFETRELDGPLAIASGAEFIAVEPGATSAGAHEIARLVPWHAADGRRGAILLARSSGVVINGRPALPVTVLRRGSEIRAGATTCYFTDERPLRVVSLTLDHGMKEPTCTRCQGPIHAGNPVVFCPLCGVVYMAQPDKSPNCWDFGPCLVCSRDPDVAFVWEPDPRNPVAARSQSRRAESQA